MSKISGWNFSQHITSADNFKQKSEVLNTWRVGMNNFARNAEGQDNTRNILDPKTFLEFLVKIFTLGYVDFREGANKRGNTSRLTQSFHFFMFEPIFSPVNAL
ncbi:hypothetical protein ACVMK2_18565, partial [Escherichia coli]